MATVLIDLSKSINYGAKGVAQVVQCVKTLLTTRVGTQPLDRQFGINFDFLDAPLPLAQAMIQQQVFEQVRKYENRCQVKSVQFKTDGLTGKIEPLVTVEIRG